MTEEKRLEKEEKLRLKEELRLEKLEEKHDIKIFEDMMKRMKLKKAIVKE